MKEMTEKELVCKVERYCIQAERCCAEVSQKLQLWGATEEQAERIVAHLLQERYVDEARFSVAFARDKMRYNHWGRVKILHALTEKGISRTQAQDALQQLDEEEYAGMLQKVLRDKWRQVKGKNDYECRQKLIRFALGRGFEMHEVLNEMDEACRKEEEDE